jgi:hypothetical protein
LDAVRNRRYAVISDAVNRPAPRIVAAIEDLARQLHPNAFAEKPEPAKGKNGKENPAPAVLQPIASGALKVTKSDPLIAEECACAR